MAVAAPGDIEPRRVAIASRGSCQNPALCARVQPAVPQSRDDVSIARQMGNLLLIPCLFQPGGTECSFSHCLRDEPSVGCVLS